jgi:hypothetical protein
MKREGPQKRKLQLKRESIQVLTLSPAQLTQVVGGSVNSGCWMCPSVRSACCPPTEEC